MLVQAKQTHYQCLYSWSHKLILSYNRSNCHKERQGSCPHFFLIEYYSMKMTSNIYKNEIIDNNDNQHFHRILTDRFETNRQIIKPDLFEQTVTTTTTTTINKEINSSTDEMTTVHLEKSPLRRVNIISGPQSAYARLFPDKYRREQEELARKQRSRSTDNRSYNFDQIKTSDDEATRKSRRVSFYDQYLSDQIGLNTHTKSDPYLHEDIARIPLNYDPNPEIIYRDNPNKVVYVQKHHHNNHHQLLFQQHRKLFNEFIFKFLYLIDQLYLVLLHH